MALVTMQQLLQRAGQENCAVGAFSVGNMEMILGAVQAAEEEKEPIILQIAEVRLPYAPLGLIGPMMLAAAQRAEVEIAVHFDHGQTIAAVEQALRLGFTSVMFDGSSLPLAENINQTAEVAALAKSYGATVEAELGVVGGAEGGGVGAAIRCTDPDEATLFARETGIDALAVAIGNAHGNYISAPCLRFDVLEAIRAGTGLPLVLHGGTGISRDDFQHAIQLGVRKINVATANFDALTQAAYQYLSSTGKQDYFTLNEAMRRGVYENVKRHIRIFQNREEPIS